jgi:Hydroxyphenylpyruvate dioxygenase, HPPD, N-terminal
VDTIENPMGTDGFEFVEYTADVQALAQLFERMGFRAIARHRSKQVVLYRQGDITSPRPSPRSTGLRCAPSPAPAIFGTKL